MNANTAASEQTREESSGKTRAEEWTTAHPGPLPVKGRGRSELSLRPPRVGFLGVGWIGCNRMQAIANSHAVEIAAIADPAEELRRKAAEFAPNAALVGSSDDLFATDLDAIVIATPSALHAAQSIAALERGLAVFCQKPPGRTAAETQEVVAAAKRANLLLGVDFSYRFMTEVKTVCDLVRSGELGQVFAVDLVFHNAYGPDKPWFYERQLSGGGCVIDLGIHLVDIALWSLGFPEVTAVTSRLFAKGQPLKGMPTEVEDFATARIDLETGASVQISCSWNAPAGRDAVISGTFYGTGGGAAFHNVDGSFYEFVAERFQKTRREVLAHTRESWGGKAAVDWAQRLACNERFNPEVEGVVKIAEVLDRIYQNES